MAKAQKITRHSLAVTVAVQLAKMEHPPKDVATATEEWLDGNKWAGDLFDQNEWDFRLFVLDVMKVYEQYQKK
jgi:hypothetical protein